MCATKKVGVILVFPEDLGGLQDSGPTTIWALQEVNSLEGLQGGLRGAAHLCQIGDSEHMRPLGIFSNLANVCKSLHQGWPNLVSTVVDHIPTLSCIGPLQKTCPCLKTHKAMRGTSSGGLFLSQSVTSLSIKFWKQCFSGVRNCQLPLGRRDRLEPIFTQHRTTATRGASISGLDSFITQHSLQTLEGGHALHEHSEGFRVGTRSRAVLQEGIRWWHYKRLWPICTMECWQPVSYSSGYDVGARTPRKRSIWRSTSSRLLRETSRIPRTTKGPLVPSETREVSDGNGRRALLLDGGDGSELVVKGSGSGLGACPVCFDEYIGRGSSQPGLGRCPMCNTYKVSVSGRKLAIQNFAEAIRTDQKLREHLPRLAGQRLVCH